MKYDEFLLFIKYHKTSMVTERALQCTIWLGRVH